MTSYVSFSKRYYVHYFTLSIHFFSQLDELIYSRHTFIHIREERRKRCLGSQLYTFIYRPVKEYIHIKSERESEREGTDNPTALLEQSTKVILKRHLRILSCSQYKWLIMLYHYHPLHQHSLKQNLIIADYGYVSIDYQKNVDYLLVY